MASKGVWGLRAKFRRIWRDRPALASTGRSTPTSEGTGGRKGSFKRGSRAGFVSGLVFAQALVNCERWRFTRPGEFTRPGRFTRARDYQLVGLPEMFY